MLLDNVRGVLGALGFDALSAVVFVIALVAWLYWKRDQLTLQKIAFPFLYVFLFRTSLGLSAMERLSKRHRELVRLFGLICIGLAFFGMVLMSVLFVRISYLLVFQPESPETQVSFILPFTEVGGVGYLSFWHWIVSLFIIAVVHEFAHGVMARAHDVPVKSSGFGVLSVLVPIFPVAFVEPDEQKLKKKSDVVQYSVFAAGPVVNILIAIMLLAALPYVGSGIVNLHSGIAPFEDRITEPVGFSYELIDNQTLPASAAGMPREGVISAFNSQKVETYNEFVIALWRVRPGETVNITVKDTVYTLVTTEHPTVDSQAYVGIMRRQNERAAIEGVGPLAAGLFYWTKGLFRWIFILNFFVGLFNLLPAIIVDGGRMLQVALDRVLVSKETAKKIWTNIGLFLMAVLLFALLTSYLGNPFSLLR